MEGHGYNFGYKDVTDSTASASVSATSSPPPTAEERILRYLEKCDIPQQVKIVALRTGVNLNTAKVTLSRMYHKRLVDRDVTGYKLPVTSFEQQMNKEMAVEVRKACLPKVHDIHLTFKPDNLREAHKLPETQGLFFKIEYVEDGNDGDRGPDASRLQQHLIPGCQNIPSLSLPPLTSDFLRRVFNPFDPASLYQLWRSDSGKTKEIKGGFQEDFSRTLYALRTQFYGTGTIKVIIANSEHPFDALGLREALAGVDGLFLARTGISFLDISPFFYFEQVHVGNDVVGERIFAGATRLACTVQQFDGWLYRTYEKILGDELYIRNEVCIQNGNMKENNVNAMLSMIQGGITPTTVLAGLYKVQKDQEELRQGLLALTKQASQTYKMIQYHIGKEAES